MNELILAYGSAVWLGILTSISPCPLATNIAAVSFIGRDLGHSVKALLSGLFYTLGRTATYCLLALFLVSGTSSVPRISMFLQQNMKVILGPLLIVIGIVLLGVIKTAFSGFTISVKTQKKLASGGPPGAFALGVLFALSFCPVSAALFFGSTFGLALSHNSRFIIPFLYGTGTAAPVIIFAFVIVFAAKAAGRLFEKVTLFEKWSRRISAIVFIAAGIYITLGAVFSRF